jgi:hypothetical protein
MSGGALEQASQSCSSHQPDLYFSSDEEEIDENSSSNNQLPASQKEPARQDVYRIQYSLNELVYWFPFVISLSN